MGTSTDQIRQEIDQSRNDAAAKIDQLQSQVQGTADDLRGTIQDTTEGVLTGVQDTASQVRQQVSGAVEDTVHTVTQNVDLRKMVEERPLLAVGAALVGGFVLGGITGGDDGGHNGHQQRSMPTMTQSGPGAGSRLGHSLRDAIQKSGIEDTLSSAAAALVGSISDQIKGTMDRNMPGFAEKMDSAKETPGGFADKARETQAPGA